MNEKTDVIVVGGGLAGLVAATEIADAGKRVIVVDQEAEQSLGGQAFWSLGGLFMVDTPEQRRFRIKDSYDLALSDWMGTAGFDRVEDLIVTNGKVEGARGAVLEPTPVERGVKSSRREIAEFTLRGQAVIVAS